MRVYIAAPYAARTQARAFAVDLETADHEVTSTWLMESHEISSSTVGAAPGVPDEEAAIHAHADLEDIENSDALVLLTESVAVLEGGIGNSGGRHVETGYAIARRKIVVVVGERENIFHRAPALVTVVPTMADVVTALAAVRRCRVCGCTDINGCQGFLSGPCSWAERDLCSICKALGAAEVAC